jgi:hypothetical protein
MLKKLFFIFALISLLWIFNGCDFGLFGGKTGNKELSSSNQIQSLEINGIKGIVDHDTGTIVIVLPTGSSVENLTAIILHEGTAISPSVESPQNFSTPVIYTVTAEDGSEREYTVSALEEDL